MAQTPEWINLANGDKVFCIKDAGDNLWIGTDGGLVKLNKVTENINYYNRANAGLPGNHILSLAIDSEGKPWVGSRRNGIGVFDGINCTVYNTYNSDLPFDQWNTAITVDKEGNKWIGSLRYLSMFDGHSWTVYKTGSDLSAFISINDIKFDSNNIGWIGASWGLGKFENGELTEKYAGFDKEINSLLLDSLDTLWIGTNNAGLWKFDGQNFTVFDTSNSYIPSNTVFSMKFDSKGNFWLATGGGLAKYDGFNWEIYNKDNSELPENTIFTLEIDKEDIIWLGMWHYGLIKFDGVNWKKYEMSNSVFPSNNIYDIKFGKNENLWFGTYNALVKFDYNEWFFFDSTNSGLKNPFITSLEYDHKDDNLWIGSRWYNCLTKFDGIDWFVYDSTNSILTYEEINCLKIGPLGNLWIATLKGLVKFDGENWLRYSRENTPLTSNFISDIVFDDKENLWISSYTCPFTVDVGCLAKFDGENWTIYNSENSGLPKNSVGNLAFDSQGIIWMSCEGLTKFDVSHWTTYNMDNSSLPTNSIHDIFVDSLDIIWLGTGAGGLVRFDRENEWLVYNTRNSGISSNTISVINIDSKGNKWIGHLFSGLSVFREGGVIITDTINGHPPILNKFTLFQNYPNPFNDQTIISYNLPEPVYVELIIYNTLGQKIRTLVNGPQSKGHYSKSWDGLDDFGKKSSSSLYVYVLKTDNVNKVRKMILLK
jgi:ligand-binding sensor domain-containing protein